MPATPKSKARYDTAPRFGLRSLAATVAKVARPALRKRGLAAAKILTDWPQIVGAELARQSMPERLSGSRGGQGGVLHIRVGGPLAVELQHLEPLVIEKINTYFGYRAVERMKLIHGPIPAPAEVAARATRTLDPAEEAEIDARLEAVADGDLRAALARLGRAVAGRGKSQISGRDSGQISGQISGRKQDEDSFGDL